MPFTFAFHYEVKCPDTPGGFKDRFDEIAAHTAGGIA
jgi:hypothetical protein